MYSYSYASKQYKWEYALPNTNAQRTGYTEFACGLCRHLGRISATIGTPITKVVNHLKKDGWQIKPDGSGATCGVCQRIETKIAAEGLRKSA